MDNLSDHLNENSSKQKISLSEDSTKTEIPIKVANHHAEVGIAMQMENDDFHEGVSLLLSIDDTIKGLLSYLFGKMDN